MDESEDPILSPVKLAALPADPWLAKELEQAIKGIDLLLTRKKMDSLHTMHCKWRIL
jgi:hypothetical protein